MDLSIWNKFQERSIALWNQENIKISSSTGNLIPGFECPEYLKNHPIYSIQKKFVSMRDLRYILVTSEPKLFLIDDLELIELLFNTKNKIKVKKLPFDYFFINVNLGGGYKGILVNKLNNPEDIQINIRKEFENGNAIFLEDRFKRTNIKTVTNMSTFYSGQLDGIKNPNDYNLTPKEIKPELDKLRNFVCNFLDLLNHPDVETREIKWTTNENRIKRGKLPIPNLITIKLKGKLYRYIYEELPLIRKNSCNFSFWVRGHYIHFWNKQKYRWIYSLNKEELEKKDYYLDKENIVCKWILPYIKNKEKGEPIKKIYKVIKNDTNKKID